MAGSPEVKHDPRALKFYIALDTGRWKGGQEKDAGNGGRGVGKGGEGGQVGKGEGVEKGEGVGKGTIDEGQPEEGNNVVGKVADD